MAGGSRSSREVTVREGTGGRNWYVTVGYVAGGISGTVFLVWSYFELWRQATATHVLALLFLLLVGTAAAFLSLFKDSAYLRRTTAEWNPKWWYYIGSPFAVSMAIHIALDAAGYGEAAPAAGLTIFAVTSMLSNVHYLYTRHRYVGVP